MSTVKLSIAANGITKRLQSMGQRVNDLQGFLGKEIYASYQEKQIERWNTENSSEGSRWKPLQPAYAKSKLSRFKGYPYSGTKMLVATSTLLQSVVGGDQKYHRKVTNKGSLVVQTTVPYASDVAEVRPFMDFSKETQKEWSRMILDHIKGD